jgi:hypothetical protein
MASVRVIVPCYNYARYLPDAVESALAQPDVDIRVLIIDDASTDDSATVAEQLAESDGRVEFIWHSSNRGHIATYNEGLESTQTDYVVLLSADDLLTPGALKRATDLMDAYPSVGLVYGHPLVFRDGEPLPPPRARRHTRAVWQGHDWVERMCRAGRNFIYCPEVVMRTAIQHRIGGYDPRLPHSGDMEMWLRAATVSDIGRINGADQAYYRLHRSSMQRTVYKGAIIDLEARAAAFDSALARSDFPDAAQLRDLAHRSIAVLALRELITELTTGAAAETIDAEAYLVVAQASYPPVTLMPEWRKVLHVLADRQVSRPSSFARLRHDLRSRLDWQYWRWSGLAWPV